MTVQEGVEKAREHLQTVLPEYAARDWQLEELETAPGGTKWLFTFTATSNKKKTGELSLEDFLRPFRITKLVEVDAETGALLAVRNKAA